MHVNRRESLLVTLLVTGLPTAGLAGQSILSGHDASPNPAWPAAPLAGFGEAWPWLLLTPLVLWLTDRFPFEVRRWALTASAHSMARLVALTFCAGGHLHHGARAARRARLWSERSGLSAQAILKDSDGREIQKKKFEPWLVSYWADHAVKEIRIVGIQKARSGP